MMKLLVTFIMMFAFGTSTVNAQENTTNIEDRIDELAEIKSDNQAAIKAAIKAKIDELSEDELKAVIVNVNELTEPTEDDLAIKEAATSAILEKMKKAEEYVTNADDSSSELTADDSSVEVTADDSSVEVTADSDVETSDFLSIGSIGVAALGLILMAGALIMLLMGYTDESAITFLFGMLMIVITLLM